MKKLQHQSSTIARTPEVGNESSPDIPLDQSILKSLQGKALLIEERNRSISCFYQQKIQQLRQVLQKQQDTKHDLTQELAALSIQNQQQNAYVDRLKKQAEGKAQKSRLERVGFNGRGGSRSRGKQLFLSKNLGKAGPVTLKKCKSSQFIESEYLLREKMNNPERRQG